MKRRLRSTGKEIAKRWHERMPRFFYWLIVAACGIGGGAAAINQLVPLTGGVLHEWWVDLYPYVFGTCVGIVFACKFTVAGGYRDLDPDKLTGGTVLGNDTGTTGEEQTGTRNVETEGTGAVDDCPGA